jgi:pimeloyl-ACP methyl ester carboxylesterase
MKLFNAFAALVSLSCLASCSEAKGIPTAPANTPILTTAIPPANDLTYEQAVHMFDYDNMQPFEIDVVGEREAFEGGYVTELRLSQGENEAIEAGWLPAYIVQPEGDGPFAAILFVHWLGSPYGSREEFLEEAKILAPRGVISLLVSGSFPWRQVVRGGEEDRAQVIEQVIELRHALDFLFSVHGVDKGRVAFVGHDYGAMHGAVMSGVEDRVQHYVFMTGLGTYSYWSLGAFNLQAIVDPQEYEDAMAVVDPVFYVPHAAPASLLFQFSTSDQYIPPEMAEEFFDAASEAKEIRWYDESHRLGDEAQAERIEWLAEQLGLLPTP